MKDSTELYCKKQSNQKLTANTVSTLRRTIYFVFVPLFWKRILTKQNIASTKNSQDSASQVPVLKRNKATNSRTSKHPFFTELQ